MDAAALVAADALSNAEIAAQVNIGERTLQTWKQHPEFAARVAELVAAFAERARSSGLGRIDVRMAAYRDRHDRMNDLIAARAASSGKGVGAETGLLVRSSKIVSSGEGSYVVEEWTFDNQLMRELRELEKQAAQDAGDWSEKVEHSGDVGAVVIREIRVPRPDGDA